MEHQRIESLKQTQAAMPTLEMISPDETDDVIALFHATEAGDIDEMKRLLGGSPSVLPVDAEEEGSGVTALCIASGLAISPSCSESICCIFLLRLEIVENNKNIHYDTLVGLMQTVAWINPPLSYSPSVRTPTSASVVGTTAHAAPLRTYCVRLMLCATH